MNILLQQLIQPIIDFYDNGIYYPNLFLLSLLLFFFLLCILVIKIIVVLPKLISALFIVKNIYSTIRKKRKIKTSFAFPEMATVKLVLSHITFVVAKSFKFVNRYIQKLYSFIDDE